ncbi:MAG: aminotransferase class I/II-fold pyridoxal phosphate-dependent enzyme [Opitutae bacterium]|nr:aminotransferase class I/II-fold pyridoxal phosphate-dependent enzyme [Opitutae bacterium]
MTTTTSPRLFLSPPHMSGREQELVRQAFESNYIAPLGPMVDAFEAEFSAYTGIPHCLALSSGTAATHLALRHLGAGPGDEVFASTLTFIGSVTPVTFQGATPVFIDCDEASWNMDPSLLEQALADAAKRGKPPRAVLPTDLYGQPCDLSRIRAVCDRYGVPVVCDSAEAMGARYRGTGDRGQEAGGSRAECPISNIQYPISKETAGSRTSDLRPPTSNPGPRTSEPWRHAGFGAWAAVFSFNGNKIITTSGGGMLASHDSELIDHARKLSQQARDPAPWYQHTEIGFNYRMSNILAAIGRGQLEVLDERVARRREIFDGYRTRLGELPGISFMPEPDGCRGNRWLTVIRIDPAAFGADTHAVREALETENIEARPVWKPMHLQPVFQGAKLWTAANEAVSNRLFEQGLCLPSGTAMTDGDLDRVCGIIRRISA